MSKLKLNITMSLDGYVAGPEQSTQHPLGIGGEQLHDWLVPLKAFRESHGEEGGEVNASTPFAEDILAGAGATIMGLNMFGGGPRPWDNNSRKGWWGDDPPFHHPAFVLTHHPREPLSSIFLLAAAVVALRATNTGGSRTDERSTMKTTTVTTPNGREIRVDRVIDAAPAR